jgi:hypothetical protein
VSAPRSTFAERLVEKIARRSGPDRRGFLRGSALVGAAVVATPATYLTRPTTAYAAVCGSHSTCASGYTVFCCTVNRGLNACPPNSFIGGWWKADNASYCGGAARYYIDCNAYRNNNPYRCRCNSDPSTCDHRLVACNQFRYGQCNAQIPLSNTGPIVCRLVSCVPPWREYPGVCTTSSRTDNNTTSHFAPCLTAPTPRKRPPTMFVAKLGTSRYRLVTGDRYISISATLALALQKQGIPLVGVSEADEANLWATLVSEADPQ